MLFTKRMVNQDGEEGGKGIEGATGFEGGKEETAWRVPIKAVEETQLASWLSRMAQLKMPNI